MIILSEPENYEEIASNIKINASSIGNLAIERFKMALALNPEDPQTKDLREKLVEDA